MVTKLISKILMLRLFVGILSSNVVRTGAIISHMPSCSIVKAEKKADVKKLLAAIGASEDVMEFYTNAGMSMLKPSAVMLIFNSLK